MHDETLYKDTAKLLGCLWRGVSKDFKSAYRTTIWQIFENRVRTTANQTSTLRRFVSEFSRKLDIQMSNPADITTVAQLCGSSTQQDAIDLLRSEASYLIMLLRVNIMERRESYENENPKEN